MAFIEKNRTRPFFCYLALNTPHSPMQVPDRHWDKFAALDPTMSATDPKLEDVAMTRAALAMVENIDWNVGRILKRLEELKADRNTIVIYFSDNGPNSWRWNGGMKGRKGQVDEGGIRSPLLIRYPERIRPNTRIPQIAAAIDLFPTLADLAGIPVLSTKPLDGKSLKPLLVGESAGWSDRMIFSLWNQRVSVRTQQYRFDPQGRLYDMKADPGQTRDITAEKPEVAATLRAAANKWSGEMLPLVGRDDRPFLVGHGRVTLLPARDGVEHGNVKRSARAPNSSYFTNWISKDDTITWDVEVVEDGEYTVDLYYTCAAADVGSTIELRFNNARLEAQVRPANDPPFVGEKEDRVARAEGYIKDFRPLRLGEMKLARGRALLTLRASHIAGRQVADVRRLVFTR
jgi:hypothetical protein